MSANTQDPWSIEEFQDLIAASFNLTPEPALPPRRRHRHHLYDPVSPPRLSLPHAIDPNSPPSPSSSYFEDSDSENGDPNSPDPSPSNAVSTSFAGRLLRHHRAHLYIKPLAAAKLFHTVRSRASALMLRPPPDTRAAAPLTIDVDASFISSLSTLPRSSISSRHTARARSSSNPPPPPPASRRPKTAPLPFGSRDLNTSRSFSPQSFLKLEPTSSRGRISSRFASILHSRGGSISTSILTTSSVPKLESFFDDSAYFDDSELTSPVPPYARSATPLSVATQMSSGTANASAIDLHDMQAETASMKIHTRLPLLRKTRSYAPGFLKRVGERISKSRSTVALRSAESSSSSARSAERTNTGVSVVNSDIGADPGTPVSATSASRMFGADLWCESEGGEGEGGDMSFLFPRPPPQPPSSVISHEMDEDEDGPLEVPPYVFERRGSAGSIGTTMTGRSTRSGISARLAKFLPSKMKPHSLHDQNNAQDLRMKRSGGTVPLPPLPRRLASKLSMISISTPSSSSSPTTSGSPHTPSEAGFGADISEGICDDCLHDGHDGGMRKDLMRKAKAREIGRVLTPEEDPFKKPDIWVEKGTDGRRESVETVVLHPRNTVSSGSADSADSCSGSGSGSGSGHEASEEGGESEMLTPRPTIRIKNRKVETADEEGKEEKRRKRRDIGKMRTVRRMLSMSAWSPFSTPPSSRSSTPSPIPSPSRTSKSSPIIQEVDVTLVPLPLSSTGHSSSYDGGRRDLARAASVGSFRSSSTAYEFDGVTPFLRRSIRRSARREQELKNEEGEEVDAEVRTRMGSPFPLRGVSGMIWFGDTASIEDESALDDSQVLACPPTPTPDSAHPSNHPLPIIRWKTSPSSVSQSLTSESTLSIVLENLEGPSSPDSVYSDSGSDPGSIIALDDVDHPAAVPVDVDNAIATEIADIEQEEEEERPQTASTVMLSSPTDNTTAGVEWMCPETDHTLCEHSLVGLAGPLMMNEGQDEDTDEEDDNDSELEEERDKHRKNVERRASMSSGFYSACSRVGSAISLVSSSLRSTISTSNSKAERTQWSVWRRGESTPLDLSSGRVVLTTAESGSARDEVRIIGKGWEGVMGVCEGLSGILVCAASSPSDSASVEEEEGNGGEGCVRVAVRETGGDVVVALRAVSDFGAFVEDDSDERTTHEEKGKTLLVFVVPVPMSLGEIGEMCKGGYLGVR